MFAGESLASVVFRILNFGFIIAITVYLFRRYFASTLKNQMIEHEAEQKSLEVHRDTLAVRQRTLKKEQQAQEQLYEDLVRKVQLWRQTFDKKVEEREQEREALKKRLEQKADRVVQEHTIHTIEQQIVPAVLERVTSELHTVFASEKKGNDFIAQVINHINDEEVH